MPYVSVEDLKLEFGEDVVQRMIDAGFKPPEMRSVVSKADVIKAYKAIHGDVPLPDALKDSTPTRSAVKLAEFFKDDISEQITFITFDTFFVA